LKAVAASEPQKDRKKAEVNPTKGKGRAGTRKEKIRRDILREMVHLIVIVNILVIPIV
jgi:hypothetical protein